MLRKRPSATTGSVHTQLQDQLRRFCGKQPVLGDGVYIAPSAVIIGDVTLGEFSSVWCNAVLRGDINSILVGHHSNIQDNAVVHLADDYPCIVGNYVTVGHGAIVHACKVGNETLVGMGATILDGSEIGEQCIIGANALVTQETVVPPGSLVLGSPGRVIRTLSDEERVALRVWAERYVETAAWYREAQMGSGQEK